MCRRYGARSRTHPSRLLYLDFYKIICIVYEWNLLTEFHNGHTGIAFSKFCKFDSKEMVARVKAVLRRYQPSRNDIPASKGKCVEYPGIVINLTNYSVLVTLSNTSPLAESIIIGVEDFCRISRHT